MFVITFFQVVLKGMRPCCMETRAPRCKLAMCWKANAFEVITFSIATGSSPSMSRRRCTQSASSSIDFPTTLET